MFEISTGIVARYDFTILCNVLAEQLDVFVIYIVNTVGGEVAGFVVLIFSHGIGD